MKLADSIGNLAKKASVIASAAIGTLAMAYDYIPQLQALSPEPGWGKWVPWVILAARIIKFKGDEPNGG